jgi:hypothetical protein
VPLVAELVLALFLTNRNDKVYQAFWHLEELKMLPKENLTMYFANWCNGEFGSIFSSGKFQQFHPPTQKPFPGPVVAIRKQPGDEGHYDFCKQRGADVQQVHGGTKE